MLKIDLSELLMPTRGSNVDLGGESLDAQLQAVSGTLWLLKDEFTTNRAAGSINGTTAEPGPGIRTVRDVENKIALSGGWAEWTAQATPVYAEQDLVYATPTINRVAGQIVLNKWRCATDNPHYPLALVSSTTPTWNHTDVQHGFWRASALSLATIGSATLGPVVCTFVADGTIYSLAIIQRATGSFYYIRGGAFTNWTLLFVGILSNTTPLYVASAGNTAVFSTDAYHWPSVLWLPVPMLSTSGAMTWPTTNGLGHAEGVAGGLGSGGSGLTLLDAGTWSVAGGYVLNTPGLGTECIDDVGFDNAAKWTAGAGWDVGVTTPGVATKVAGASTSLTDTAATQAVVGRWYALSATVVKTAGSSCVLYNGDAGGPGIINTGTHYFTVRVGDNTFRARIAAAADFAGTVDNFSCKPFPISNLITNTQLSTTDVLAEEVIHAQTSGTQVGMAVNLDRSFAAKCASVAAAGQAVISLKEVTGVGGVGISTNETITIAGTTYTVSSVVGGSNVAYNDTTKTQTVTLGSNLGAQVNANDKVGIDWASWNGVLTYFDGADNVKLDEVKAGVYTNRLSAAVTFVADKRLITRKIGTSYYVWYNEALVGSTTAVDAAAQAGMYHGMFSTLAANTITSLLIYYVGSNGEYNANLNTFST